MQYDLETTRHYRCAPSPILALDQTNAQLRSHRLRINTRTAIGTDDHSLPGLSTCRNPSWHLLIQVGGNSSFSIYLLYTHAGYELISFLSDYIVIASPDGWRQTQYVYHFSAISAQSCPSAMRSLLKYTIAFFLSVCVRGIVMGSELEKRDNITLQAPVVAVPSQYWYVVHQNNIPQALTIIKGGRRWNMEYIRNPCWHTYERISSSTRDIMARDLGGIRPVDCV
jgi:hypothetical protein